MFADATSLQEDDPDPTDDALVEIVASRFSLRPGVIDIQGCDGGWIDFVVGFSFEADGPREVRSEADRIIRTCGRDVEVFSVLDEGGAEVLTEDDL